jgi:hypothetical protein
MAAAAAAVSEGVPPPPPRRPPSLPTELAGALLGSLDGEELLRARSVSRGWRLLADGAAVQVARGPGLRTRWEAEVGLALAPLGDAARASLARVDREELEALQTFGSTPPLSCGALLLALADLVGAAAWNAPTLLGALRSFTERLFTAPFAAMLLEGRDSTVVRLRAALNGTNATTGATAVSQQRAAESQSFGGLLRTVGSVGHLHAWLQAVLDARKIVVERRRSMFIMQRAGLLALLGPVAADLDLQRKRVRTQLVELSPTLVTDDGSVVALRKVLAAEPGVTEGLLNGRHACAARTRPPPADAAGARYASPRRRGADAAAPATAAITIAASAAAGAVLSRRDLVETFGSSGFTVSPSVAAQSYQATGQSAASSEETS